MEFVDLLTSLLPKAAKWNSIGIQLGLSPDELATIRADSNDVQECLRRVLQKLYDRTPHPTWGQVITALRAPLLEEMKLAKELEHKMIFSMKQSGENITIEMNTFCIGRYIHASACFVKKQGHYHRKTGVPASSVPPPPPPPPSEV